MRWPPTNFFTYHQSSLHIQLIAETETTKIIFLISIFHKVRMKNNYKDYFVIVLLMQKSYNFRLYSAFFE